MTIIPCGEGVKDFIEILRYKDISYRNWYSFPSVKPFSFSFFVIKIPISIKYSRINEHYFKSKDFPQYAVLSAIKCTKLQWETRNTHIY